MELPTFDEAADRVENGVGTALDEFIYNQGPVGEAHEREFREGLAAVLAAASSKLADKPGAWIIRYPDGVVISIVGENVPDCYAKFATPYYAKEKNHDAN